MADKFGVPFLGKIPLDPDIVKAGDAEQPYICSYPNTKTARIFDEIVEWIVRFGRNTTAGTVSEPAPALSSEGNNGDGTQETGNGADAVKFAVPTNEGKLCQHFGHCEAFAVIDTDRNGNIVNETCITPPPHEPGLLPPWLSRQGVNCVIAGGMGSPCSTAICQ